MAIEINNNSKRLLITGATGGMGRACSILGAQEGYQLILADLNEEKLAALAEDCRREGADAEYHVLDVTNAEHIQNMVEVGSQGGFDAVIHTVGISPTMAGWEKIVSIDLVGTINFLETIRPHINAGGAVLGITSMSAYMATPNPELEAVLKEPLAPNLLETLNDQSFAIIHDPGMAYCYSKKALKTYFALHARGWGRENRRLVSLAPGLIATEMGMQENAAHEEGFKAMMQMVGIDRMGQAEDIANTALFLVSDRASYICGIDVLVDGGIIGTMQSQG